MKFSNCIGAYSGSTEKYCRGIKLDAPSLIRVVEELGKDANGRFAELAIVEIPEGVKWYIAEYDGTESVHEEHRVWTPTSEVLASDY